MRTCLSSIAMLLVCLAAEPAAAKIVHRWSFEKDASDSVGGVDAILWNGAAVKVGKVSFDGQKNWIDLPIEQTIQKLTSATFEAWFTWDEKQSPWARIFDFGRDENVYLFLTVRGSRPQPGAIMDTPRFALTKGGWREEEMLCAPEPLEVGKLTHIAVTIDSENQVGKLYINGKEVVKGEMKLTPAALGDMPNHQLGVSQWEADPMFNGSITEFRIYDTALSAEQIAQNNKAGPDKLPDSSDAGRTTAEKHSPSAMKAGGKSADGK